MVLGPTPGGELHLPVSSVMARRFASVVKQQYDFSCGSAALATLMTHHYSDAQSEQSVFLGMWQHGDRAQIRKLGFSLLDMKRYLQARGMDGNGYRVDLDRIARTGVAGIALTTTRRYQHFVVVKGIQGNTVLVGDPSTGLRVITKQEFERIWNGVYFVVSNGAAKSTFNTASDWSLTPRGRHFAAAEPLSLQSLALMSSRYGEF
jgi:predicted double-glycine peptidase